MRSLALLAAVFALTGCLSLSASRSIAASATKHSHCKRPRSTTLRETRKVRIFAMPRESVTLPGGRSIDGRPVFGCLKSIGEARLLNAPGEQEGYGFGVDEHAFGVRAPMVAYVFIVGHFDSQSAFVRVRNLNTNVTVRGCPVGGGLSPGTPRVAEIVMDSRGKVAWSVEGGTFGSPFAVVACDSTGQHVLDSGEGIDLESLALHGSVVRWLDGGSRREANLE